MFSTAAVLLLVPADGDDIVGLKPTKKAPLAHHLLCFCRRSLAPSEEAVLKDMRNKQATHAYLCSDVEPSRGHTSSKFNRLQQLCVQWVYCFPRGHL